MQKVINVFIMKTHILAILIVLSCGCVSVSHKDIDRNQVLTICQEEYSELNKKDDDKWFSVFFTVKNGGELLPEKKYNEDKKKTLELRKKIPLVIAKMKKKEKLAEKEAHVLGLFLFGGDEYPKVGSRAKLISWTNSEHIIFTTNDGKYDIKIKLVFSPENEPVDIKKLAKNVSKKYNSL